MITFMPESFRAVYPEMYPLLLKHYKEISHHGEHGFDLNPQLETYYGHEDAGSLLTMVGREEGEIVAYLICFIAPGLHYKDCLTCSPDIFFVAPEKRNGMAGVRLFQAVKKELIRRGVKLWFIGSKNAHDSTALFRFMKFKPVESTYSMWLEG